MKLTEYIKGERRGKEANRIERKAMRDPFLYDALDGFDTVEGNHAERIADIQRRLSHRSRRTNHWMAYAGIAASLLVCVIAGGYFIFNKDSVDFVVKSEAPANEIAFEEQLPVKEQESEDVLGRPDNEMVGSVNDEQRIRDYHYEDATEAESDAEEVLPKNKKILPADKADELKRQAVIKDELTMIDDDSSEQSATVPKPPVPVSDAHQEIIQDELPVQDELAQNEKASGQGDVKALNDAVVSGYGTVRSATEKERARVARLETPEPKIGWKAYRKYLKDSLRRPSDDECSKSKGTVEVTFHIDKEGVPYDFVIGKSLCPSADAEATRLVKEGSLWTCESYKRMKVEVKF